MGFYCNFENEWFLWDHKEWFLHIKSVFVYVSIGPKSRVRLRAFSTKTCFLANDVRLTEKLWVLWQGSFLHRADIHMFRVFESVIMKGKLSSLMLRIVDISLLLHMKRVTLTYWGLNLTSIQPNLNSFLTLFPSLLWSYNHLGSKEFVSPSSVLWFYPDHADLQHQASHWFLSGIQFLFLVQLVLVEVQSCMQLVGWMQQVQSCVVVVVKQEGDPKSGSMRQRPPTKWHLFQPISPIPILSWGNSGMLPSEKSSWKYASWS